MSVRRAWVGASCALGLTLSVAGACEPSAPPDPAAPANVCPEHPCSAYAGGPTATCPAGACVISGPPSGIVLVVSVATDATYASGLQYVVPFEHLAEGGDTLTCAWPACARLQGLGSVLGGYLMSVHDQSGVMTGTGGVGFFLGNRDDQGDPLPTWLPSHVTYRMLTDPWGDDVTAFGLPVWPVQAAQATLNPPPLGYLGPSGSAGTTFAASLVPGTYERTVAPDPSYNTVFPPQVRSDVVINTTDPNEPGSFETVFPGEEIGMDAFDVTSDISLPPPILPTFTIQGSPEVAGSAARLDGFTAFLRDATTKRVISNVRPLSGTVASNVQLFTNHATPDPSTRNGATDALANAELVVEPPDGVALPTAVFQQLTMTVPYPPHLPGAAHVTGSVVGPWGAPLAADLVFEALAFADDTGTFKYLPPFEYVGHASARPSVAGGPSTFGPVDLPQGPYRVDVQPLDGSAATTVLRLDVMPGGSSLAIDLPLSLGSTETVHGTASLSDGRPLGGAVVDVLPAGCAAPTVVGNVSSTRLDVTVATPWCLPRPIQAQTNPDGSFILSLDPGSYTLRVRPAPGTNLPWVLQPLLLGASTPSPDVVVPVPFHLSFQLHGADDVALFGTTVQAFALPALQGPSMAALLAGQAALIGETITTADGTCDLYLTLPE